MSCVIGGIKKEFSRVIRNRPRAGALGRFPQNYIDGLEEDPNFTTS